MKIGYEQIVENKQRPADTRLNGISLYPFQRRKKGGRVYVKQPERKWNLNAQGLGYNRIF
jgi:hypothetical protein